MILSELSFEALRHSSRPVPPSSLLSCFEQLDPSRKGNAGFYDLEAFFLKNAIFPSKAEIKGLIERYDRDRDGKVSWREFLVEMSPQLPEGF